MQRIGGRRVLGFEKWLAARRPLKVAVSGQPQFGTIARKPRTREPATYS